MDFVESIFKRKDVIIVESNEVNTTAVVVAVATAVTKDAYQDVLHPAAQQTGEILKLVPETVSMLLSPLSGLIWSYKTIADTIKPLIAEKIKTITEDKLKTPASYIAVPTIEALRYTLEEEELRDLFVNLLVASMNLDTISYAHPSFVEMIKQMSPLDAKLLKEITEKSAIPSLEIIYITEKADGSYTLVPHYFDFECLALPLNITTLELVSASIDNLTRLGLLSSQYPKSFLDESRYDLLENGDTLNEIKRLFSPTYLLEDPTVISRVGKLEVKALRGSIKVTSLGSVFAKACFTAS